MAFRSFESIDVGKPRGVLLCSQVITLNMVQLLNSSLKIGRCDWDYQVCWVLVSPSLKARVPVSIVWVKNVVRLFLSVVLEPVVGLFILVAFRNWHRIQGGKSACNLGTKNCGKYADVFHCCKWVLFFERLCCLQVEFRVWQSMFAKSSLFAPRTLTVQLGSVESQIEPVASSTTDQKTLINCISHRQRSQVR